MTQPPTVSITEPLDNWTQSTDTQKVPFAAPEAPYAIDPALGIVMPGLTDESAQPDGPLESKVGDLLALAASTDRIADVQFLVAPNSRGLDIIVSGSPNIRPIRENGQQRLVDSSVFETIKNKAKRCLPDIYGLEKVRVELGPLGRSAPHVSRLAVHGDEQLVVENLDFEPSLRLLKALWSARDSFIFQFILSEGDPFVGTARLATFNPEYIKRSDRGFAEIVDRGHPRSLTDIYKPTNLTDNHNLQIDDYWKTSYTPHSGAAPGYSATYSTKVTEPDYRYRQTKQQADQLKALVTGVAEYERLLRGSSNYDNLYSKLDQYPRFTLTGPDINLFTNLPQLSYLASPWDELTSRDGLEVKTREIIRDADGTKQGLYKRTTASSSDSRGSTSTSTWVANRGSRMHDETVRDGKPWFGEQGDQAEIIDQTTKSLPDLKLYPTDGEITSLGFDIENELLETDILPPERLGDCRVVTLEVEHKNGAASTLANAAQAAIDGRVVVFIATSRDKAETIASWLAHPFQDTIDDGVMIYTWTEKIVCEDGTKPVMPADIDGKKWEFTYDGRLRLRQTETDAIIVDEPATKAPSKFSFDCPFLRIENGNYVVYGPDGEELRTYSTKEAFERDWMYVYKPHVPVERSYIERSLLVYPDPDAEQFELERYHVDPDWNVSDNTERYEKMIGVVVDNHLIEQEDTELDLKRWRKRILRLYRRQTDRKEPDSGKIGEAMPEINTKQRNNPYQRLYVDHTFAFPEGIVSPALPGVDSEDGRILEWAK